MSVAVFSSPHLRIRQQAEIRGGAEAVVHVVGHIVRAAVEAAGHSLGVVRGRRGFLQAGVVAITQITSAWDLQNCSFHILVPVGAVTEFIHL